MIELLLQKGAVIDSLDRESSTALMAAAKHGSADNIRFLLANGASINAEDKWGRTALYHAVANGCHKISDFLSRGERNETTIDNTKMNAKALTILETKSEKREFTENLLKLTGQKQDLFFKFVHG